MKYNFDEVPERRNTNSLKWDVGENELPMWVADMDFNTAPEITRALIKRAEHGVYGYTVVPDEWYNAYINWWQTRHGVKFERDWLQFCTGVVPAISSIVKRVTNLGDSVLTLTPVYDIFFHSVENAGRHVLESVLVCKKGEYFINFEDLEEKLSRPLTTMFIFCNPHNPVGRIWTREEISRVDGLCKKYGVTLLSDEIHCDLTDCGENYVPFLSISQSCITCIAASKAFNTGGLQSAAVVVPDVTLRNKVVRGLNSDEVAEPNCFAVESTVAALTKGGEWLEELRKYLYENKQTALKYIGENIPQINVTKSKATYLLWLDCSAFTDNSEHFAEFLRARTGLYLSAGTQYRGDGATHVRMNIACNAARLNDGLERLKRGVEEYISYVR